MSMCWVSRYIPTHIRMCWMSIYVCVGWVCVGWVGTYPHIYVNNTDSRESTHYIHAIHIYVTYYVNSCNVCGMYRNGRRFGGDSSGLARLRTYEKWLVHFRLGWYEFGHDSKVNMESITSRKQELAFVVLTVGSISSGEHEKKNLFSFSTEGLSFTPQHSDSHPAAAHPLGGTSISVIHRRKILKGLLLSYCPAITRLAKVKNRSWRSHLRWEKTLSDSQKVN